MREERGEGRREGGKNGEGVDERERERRREGKKEGGRVKIEVNEIGREMRKFRGMK